MDIYLVLPSSLGFTEFSSFSSCFVVYFFSFVFTLVGALDCIERVPSFAQSTGFYRVFCFFIMFYWFLFIMSSILSLLSLLSWVLLIALDVYLVLPSLLGFTEFLMVHFIFLLLALLFYFTYQAFLFPFILETSIYLFKAIFPRIQSFFKNFNGLFQFLFYGTFCFDLPSVGTGFRPCFRRF